MKLVREAIQYFWSGRSALSTPVSRWQHPVVGYIAACLCIAAGIGAILLSHWLVPSFYFPVSSLLLAILLVSLFWGIGPGLLAWLLGCVAFSYFVSRSPHEPIIPPLSWTILFRLLPFALAGLLIAVITGQHQSAHRLVHKRADELSIMNQELERANQLKDYFMIRAAHELRTPLTTILGETQLALRRLHKVGSTTTDCQKSFEKVEARAMYLRAFVEDLLELSRLRSGEIPLRPTSCDFEKLCREVVEDQQALSGRQIEYQFSEQPLILQADCERLTQAIINLVENAVHYSLEHTIIRVRVSADQTSVLFQVHNEGPELSHEQQERIFEPFYRTSFAENVFRTGRGVGLTMSQEIVEKHHGHIWVESVEGKGTTFFVRIPFHAEESVGMP